MAAPFLHGLLPGGGGQFGCGGEPKALSSGAAALPTPFLPVLQVSDSGRLPPPTRLGNEELLPLAFRVRILWLLDRLRGCLNFPSNKQRDKVKPPAYLLTQTSKILQLCASSDVSEDLRSSVRAVVNAQL